MRYRFVLLDAGGTLLGPRGSYGSIYSEVLKPLGVRGSVREFDRAIRETGAELMRRVPAGADRFGLFPGGEDEFWYRFVESTCRRLTATAPDRDWVVDALGRLRKAFTGRSAWTVYDDVVPALVELRELGCRLGVVSNWDSRLPDVLVSLGLDRYFEVVGVSHVEGIEKPDPALFLRVMQRLEAIPRETVHVGDVRELDVAGAAAAGIDALLIDRSSERAWGDDVIGSLSELAGRIRT